MAFPFLEGYFFTMDIVTSITHSQRSRLSKGRYTSSTTVVVRAVLLSGLGFVETSEAEYMLTIVDRGADILRASGSIGDAAAEELKAEARRRVETGEFFGHIAYVSLTARKPA